MNSACEIDHKSTGVSARVTPEDKSHLYLNMTIRSLTFLLFLLSLSVSRRVHILLSVDEPEEESGELFDKRIIITSLMEDWTAPLSSLGNATKMRTVGCPREVSATI